MLLSKLLKNRPRAPKALPLARPDRPDMLSSLFSRNRAESEGTSGGFGSAFKAPCPPPARAPAEQHRVLISPR